MKRTMPWSLLLASLLLGATSCSEHKTAPETTAAPAATPAVAADSTAAPGATESVVAAAYTCPMDADVVSDQPGKCPKCGMSLVKK